MTRLRSAAPAGSWTLSAVTRSRLWPTVYVLGVLALLVLGTTVWPICSLLALVLTLPLSLVLQTVGIAIGSVVDDEGLQSTIGFVLLLGAALANAVVLATVLRRRDEAAG